LQPNLIETPLQAAVFDVLRWTCHNTPVGTLEHGQTVATFSTDLLQRGPL